MDFVTNPVVISGIALIIAYILKAIPNAKIQAAVEKTMYGLGVATTLGLSKFPWTTHFWNQYIEPWVIDAIDNIIVHGIKAYIEGMRSDNV